MKSVMIRFLQQLRLPLSKEDIKAVMQPDRRIMNKSIGAKTIAGKLSNVAVM